jgi:hypothetical protein
MNPPNPVELVSKLGPGKGTAFQTAEKVWLRVAQRFIAAIRTLFSSAALAAEVTDSTFSGGCATTMPYHFPHHRSHL